MSRSLKERLAKLTDFRQRTRFDRVLEIGESLHTIRAFINERAEPERARQWPYGVWIQDDDNFLDNPDTGRWAYFCLECCRKEVVRLEDLEADDTLVEDPQDLEWGPKQFQLSRIDDIWETSSVFCDECGVRLISTLSESGVEDELEHLLVLHPLAFHDRSAWADLEQAVADLRQDSLVWTLILEQEQRATREALLSVLASRGVKEP